MPAWIEELSVQFAHTKKGCIHYREIVAQAFAEGYKTCQDKIKAKEKQDLAEYNHGSSVQKIAAEYVRARGTQDPLAQYEENRFIDGYLRGWRDGQMSLFASKTEKEA